MNKAQQRKATPIDRGFNRYFPDAIRAVAQLSLIANDQHHPGSPLHWDRNKSTDEADALMRHLLDAGDNWDALDDDGVYHVVKVAWRGMAMAQKILEKQHDK